MMFPDNTTNHFKDLFEFTYSGSRQGITKIKMPGKTIEKSDGEDFDKINAKFENVEMVVDSFTYTPFIDYAQVDEAGDSRVGVYSDRFLNEFNTEVFNSDANTEYAQVDTYRHTLSKNMFSLRNLAKDLDDAKTKFREAITYIDSQDKEKTKQVFIYTLCEHIANLFAKLSNIRMSYIFYGFDHPHSEWEGILALDIWYNNLYKEIDAQYPFDEKYFNMSPMSRRVKKKEDNTRYYVEADDGTKWYLNADGTVKDVPQWTWMNDDTEDVPTEGENKGEYKHVILWNEGLWQRYNSTS